MKRYIAFYYIIFFISFVSIHNLQAQISFRGIMNKYNFSAVTINDGLANNYIENIYKDSKGFLWLSTHNGLSRYDGYNFENYNVSSKPLKLRSNFINHVCEDRYNRLWIASEGGLDVIDLRKNKLIKINYSIFKSEDLSSEPIYHVLKDYKGDIWLATQTNIYKVEFDNKGEIRKSVSLYSLYDKHSKSIISFKNVGKELWVGYDRNLYRLELNKDNKISLYPIIKKQISNSKVTINTFCLCNDIIWIGTNSGLYKYNVRNKDIKRYQYIDGDNSSLSHNNITDIALAYDNELVVSTSKGLNFYNPSTDDFVRIEHYSQSSDKLINSNNITCLFYDGEIFWIGSQIGGLNRMEPRNLNLQLYTYNTENKGSLSDNIINSIHEDHFGNLWVGGLENGLSYKDKNSDSFIHFSHNQADASSISHNSISCIAEDDRNNIWIGTWGGGVNSINAGQIKNGKFLHYNSRNGILKSDNIGSLAFDKLNGGMWIGTSEGLAFYDFKTNSSFNLTLPTDRLPNNSLDAMLIDDKERLWIGSHHGLFIIDLFSFAKNRKNVQYRYLEYKLDNPKSGLIEKICSIIQDSHKNIWLGSNGYGLYRLVSDKDNNFIFKDFTVKDGLADNTIFGIVESNKHHLLLSTNNGLSSFNPVTGNFVNYYEQDGLLNDQFYWNAYSKGKDGTLYFGGINGMIGINDETYQNNKQNNRVILTRLTVLNDVVSESDNQYLDNDISWSDKMTLHERDKSFSIDFSAMDFGNASRLKYYYRLKGFDDNWIECDSKRHYASYTNLESGNYTFEVKVKDTVTLKDGPITQLHIKIVPFFYKTWWFYLLVVILIATLSFNFYQWRVKELKRQREKLTIKVKERTLDLEDKMDILSTQNELLTQQKKQLIDLSKRIKEITSDKISFFTNITHEFRTPITLIMGPIDRALKLSSNPVVKEQLEIVERNSKSLLGLVNQLLDFRKVESGKISINKKSHNIRKFVDELMIPFYAFAKDRNIDITVLLHLSSSYYEYDEEWMRKVLVNLLSNSIKYTPNGGKVKLYLYSYKDKNGLDSLYMSVSDNGVGILKEDINKIFDRFYQSREHVKYPVYGQSGTGIGLFLCKRIINEHGGRIFAVNNHKAGSSFRVLMPFKIGNSLNDDIVTTDNDNVACNDSVILKKQDEMSRPLSNKNIIPISKYTILVVDDNKDMRIYVRSILMDKYKVMEASNGEEALEVLKKNQIDFIVSDLMMPIMDGIEFSRRVKNDITISHIPFLMLTAKVNEDSKMESYRIGVDEYIQKPFSEEMLLLRIKNILAARKMRQKQFDINMNPNILNVDKESRDSKFVKKMMIVIQDKYTDSTFDVDSFANEMGVSRTLLNQKMQNLIGQSTAKFIGNYRLKIAQDLLSVNAKSKNMNISEIAYQVGFNDPKYFSRCYQKKYGVLPSSMIIDE